MRTFLIALLMTLATQAGADTFFLSDLGGRNKISKFELEKYIVRVKLHDFTSGACWTNLKEAREYAEEKLKIKGLTVVEKGKFPHADSKRYSFDVIVSAKRIYADGSGPCFGAVTVEMAGLTLLNGQAHRAILGRDYRGVGTSEPNYNRAVMRSLEEVFLKFPMD